MANDLMVYLDNRMYKLEGGRWFLEDRKRWRPVYDFNIITRLVPLRKFFMSKEAIMVKDNVIAFPSRQVPQGLKQLAENLFIMQLADTPESQAQADDIVKQLREMNYIIPENWRNAP